VQAAGRTVCVLGRETPSPGQPWLLKLHGDAVDEESIVLTREQYVDHQGARGPFAGVVQAMLMTRHLLFVGYSLNDDTFIRLAHQVRRVLRRPVVSGTVVGLLPDPLRAELWEGEIDSLDIGQQGEDVATAARRLEVWLDLLAHLACDGQGFLMDEAYGDLLSSQDRKLRDALRVLADAHAPGDAAKAASRLHQLVRELGG
jgi:hypothetical protein